MKLVSATIRCQSDTCSVGVRGQSAVATRGQLKGRQRRVCTFLLGQVRTYVGVQGPGSSAYLSGGHRVSEPGRRVCPHVNEGGLVCLVSCSPPAALLHLCSRARQTHCCTTHKEDREDNLSIRQIRIMRSSSFLLSAALLIGSAVDVLGVSRV